MGSGVTWDNPGVFDGAGAELDSRFKSALFEVATVAEGLVKDNMTDTRDKDGHVGRVGVTGQARNGVTASHPVATSTGYRAIVTMQGPHGFLAPIIEKGRRPGPISRQGRTSLTLWVRRKLQVAEEELERVVFLIARKISRMGFPALWPFRNAAREMNRGLAKDVFEDALATHRRVDG